MRGLHAALYKDLKLMFNGVGILTIVLSALLIPLFIMGTRDLRTDSFLQPFPIAIRDEDQTVMSRSLTEQIRELEIFSDVVVLSASDPSGEDGEAMTQAALLTIPEDFFYAMYTGRECPVEITLNDNMPAQAALTRTILVSVMDIVQADQAAVRGLYAYVYGDEADAHAEAMYESASRDIFRDALSRQQIFDTKIIAPDVLAVTRRRLTAVLMPMLAMLFSLSALQTLRQERQMGAMKRFVSLRGSVISFVFSKWIAAAVWMGAVSVPLYVLAGTGRPALFALLCFLTFSASFALMCAIVFLTKDDSAARRWCNLYLLLAMFFGGTFLPQDMLPECLSFLRPLIVTRYAFPVCNALSAGQETGAVLRHMAPLLLLIAIGFAAAVPGAVFWDRKRGLSGRAKKERKKQESPPLPEVTGTLPAPLRALRLVRMKCTLFEGGFAALCIICLVSAAAGYAAYRAQDTEVLSVSLALVDEDSTADSKELVGALSGTEALSVVPCDAARASLLMIDGAVEGVLTIGKGYAEAVQNDAVTPLRYEATQSAFSAQGVREIVAGQVASQRSIYRTFAEASAMTGEILNEAGKSRLLSLIRDAGASLPPLFLLHSRSGGRIPDPFVPERLGFFALTLILLLMTAASFTGRGDARRVASRLSGKPRGMLLTYGTDIAALVITGLLIGALFFLPYGIPSFGTIGASVLLICDVALLTLFLTKITVRAGRVDALAVILTLLLCLLGGCFLDLSALSVQITALMMLSPPGAALLLSRGSLAALLMLGAGIFVFFLLGKPSAKRASA